jgi:hypothetical protein
MGIEQRLRSLLELEAEQRAVVEQLTAALSDAKDALRRTQRESLPAVLREAGLDAAELPGARVALVADCELSIPAAARWEAMSWLERSGHRGLLRREVMASPEDEPGMERAAVALIQAGVDEVVGSVKLPHYQTLRAFGRETLANGWELPEELFRLHPFDWVKITKK